MAHLSKQQLALQDLELLFNQMDKVFATLDTNNTAAFLDELLGKEEKIMIAKRLAAIAMFVEGNSSYRVWQLLKLSPSTADRIRLNYEIGKYQQIEKILTRDRKDYEQFWTTLEKILRAGMPPQGRGRWKSVFTQTT